MTERDCGDMLNLMLTSTTHPEPAPDMVTQFLISSLGLVELTLQLGGDHHLTQSLKKYPLVKSYIH